ncbi:MAG: hypothetical protein AAFY15_00150 [Cyanobacteria bacterium J06648_11]
MTGSGTCRDLCAELGIPCTSFDLKAGQDASDPTSYSGLPPHDFAWLHPPYWRQVAYSEDPQCLSQARSLEAFLERMDAVLAACRDALTSDGHVAVLMGGYCERERYLPLPALITARAASLGLWPACTEIIRFQHGNTSSRRPYRSSFIPGLHDVCTVYRRAEDLSPAQRATTNVHIDICNKMCDTRRERMRRRRNHP